MIDFGSDLLRELHGKTLSQVSDELREYARINPDAKFYYGECHSCDSLTIMSEDEWKRAFGN